MMRRLQRKTKERNNMSALSDKFTDYLQKLHYYEHVNTLIYWDMKTGAPKRGLDALSDVTAYFSTRQFELSTSDELGQMLSGLSQPEEFELLNDAMKFIVTQMKEDYDRNKNIPPDFYEEYVRIITASENAWVDAKQNNDFASFAPHLQKVIEATRKMTSYTDPGKEVYDALLDQYEKGMDSATIDGLFGNMKKELIPLVKKIAAAEQPDASLFESYYDPDAQRKVQKMLLEYIGFDFTAGTVAESEHPFTLNFSSKDVRVTNHYNENDAIDAIFTAIHEGGHAIFEQNVNPEYDGTVAGSCRYMGIHESQSRFYENILGRNRSFWLPIYDKLGELLPRFKEISLDAFVRQINHVRSSFIRCSADELTYCFHIIIRYEIEKAIFRDGVDVQELPKLWNAKMEEYLGITPDSDTVGILQDTHWADGSFGYFPSYLLGTIYDGMYLDAIQKDLGPVDTILAEGRIKEITAWLNEKIHRYGSTRTPEEVIRNVCGGEVSADPIIRFFQDKYAKLYRL